MAVDKGRIIQKPFISVVNSYEKPIPVEKVDKKNAQEVNNITSGAIVSLEQLFEELSTLQNTHDKFVFACSKGSDEQSLQLLTQLMQEKSQRLDKITDRNNGNLSLMHLCAIKNKPLCMNFLTEHKAKIDCLDKIEATPLLHAAANNCIEALTFLISKGANVNARDAWGKFPLQVALKNKHYHAAELLTSVKGIDIHQRGIKGNTVLHNMAAEGDLTAVKFLMEQCNSTPQRRNSDEDNVLQCSLAHVHVVQYLCNKIDHSILVKMVTNVNIMGGNVVHECCRNGYFDSLISIFKSMKLTELSLPQVNNLLNSADNSEDTPLLLAVKQGHIPSIKFLCQVSEIKVNSPDAQNNTALYYAAAQNNKQAMSMLTGIGASFKPDNNSSDENTENIAIRLAKSLRTLLAIILSFIAILCIVTISAVSLGFFGSYVSSTTSNLRKISFDQRLAHIKHQVEQIDTAFDVAFGNGVNLFNMTDEESVFYYNSYVYRTVYNLPFIRTVGCTLPNAAVANFAKVGNTTTFLTNYANYSISYRYPVEDFTDYTKLNVSKAEITYPKVLPPRIQMINAEKYNTSIWSESTISSNFPGYLFLYLSRGFRDPVTGVFIGACHFYSVSEFVATYLQTTRQFKSSYTAIIERSTGYLIATSDARELIYEQFDTEAVRYDGTNAKNRNIAALVQKAHKQLGGKNFPLLSSEEQVMAKDTIGGYITAINIGSISNGRGIDWVVLQGVPLREFYGSFITSIIIMCVVGVSLLVGSILLSGLLAYAFMKPIHILIEQSEAIKLLQLEHVEEELKKSSFFSEIKSLQEAFKSMTVRLKQFRNFIPHHILAVIEVEVGAKQVLKESSKSSMGTSKLTESQSKSLSDHTSESISNVTIGSTDAVNKALNSSLLSGNATIMTIRLPDYTRILDLHGAAEIDETSKELIGLFMDIIRMSKGQFVSMTSRSAVIAWNTLIKQTDHSTRACKAARNMHDGLKKLHAKWKAKNLPLLEVSIGLARGNIYYGNMGTTRMKFFTVIGNASEVSGKISYKCSGLGVQILCDENVYEAIKDEYLTRPIQKLHTEDGETTGMTYELGEARPQDAWASEMNVELKDSQNQWKAYNQAYDLYQRGLYEEAYELFVQYLQTNVTDIPAQNMMAQCRAQSDEMSPSGTLSENTTTLVDLEQPPAN